MFLNVRLSDRVEYGAASSTEHNTTLITSAGGRERRNINWSRPRLRFDVSHAMQDREGKNELLALFRLAFGRAHSFRFRDWADYQAEMEPQAVGDGSTRTYQLVKSYALGPYTVRRKITKPVQGTVRIFVNGVEHTASTAIDYLTGIITLNLPLALNQALAASFDFDVPVRFESDLSRVTVDHFDTYGSDGVALVEVDE